jgi:hypothetical protein|tara:strand:- start:3424 stop:3735 length:312 start_codon:yes stop_codon:yes gene_type:complete
MSKERFKPRYGVRSCEFVDAPNMLKLALGMDRTNGDGEWKDSAAKMYTLASAFPTMPAGVLLGVVLGHTRIGITEDRSVIFYPYVESVGVLCEDEGLVKEWKS